MESKTNINPKTQTQRYKGQIHVARDVGWEGVGQMDEGDQKVQTSSHKINKSRGHEDVIKIY